MIINGEEYDSVVFYDKEDKGICVVLADDETTVPENCNVIFFPKGSKPVFDQREDGTVYLRGAIVENGGRSLGQDQEF
jgi:hypothetical protein